MLIDYNFDPIISLRSNTVIHLFKRLNDSREKKKHLQNGARSYEYLNSANEDYEIRTNSHYLQ